MNSLTTTTSQQTHLEIFIEQAFSLLDCAIINPDDKEKVKDRLTEAIYKQQVFAREPNGQVFMPMTSNHNSAYTAYISVPHTEAFTAVVLGRIEKYRSLVEKNKKICSAYKSPIFDLSQVSEFTKDALQESFKSLGVAESYLFNS